jgi:hypothetical protein
VAKVCCSAAIDVNGKAIAKGSNHFNNHCRNPDFAAVIPNAFMGVVSLFNA